MTEREKLVIWVNGEWVPLEPKATTRNEKHMQAIQRKAARKIVPPSATELLARAQLRALGGKPPKKARDSSEPKNRGGRPPKADMELLEAAFRREVKERGFPDELNERGWDKQSDVASWAGGWLAEQGTIVSNTTLDTYAKHLMKQKRSET